VFWHDLTRTITMRNFRFPPTLLSIGGLVFANLFVAEFAFAQPASQPAHPAENAPQSSPETRENGSRNQFFLRLQSELNRDEDLAEKIGLTEEQQKRLDEIDVDRRTFFLGLRRAGGTSDREELKKKALEFEDKCVKVLTPAQNVIWESHVASRIQRNAEREAARGDRTRDRAQPPSSPPTDQASGNTGRVGPQDRVGRNRVISREPNLSLELRVNKEFAEKLALTDEQKKKLGDIDMDRATFLRNLLRGSAAPGTDDYEKRLQDLATKIQESQTKSLEVLTPDQKVIWEARAETLKKQQAEREAARRDVAERSQADTNLTPSAADRERIRVLENEVKTLKEEIAKLKAASAATKPAAP
jgi:hypothetical protein